MNKATILPVRFGKAYPAIRRVTPFTKKTTRSRNAGIPEPSFEAGKILLPNLLLGAGAYNIISILDRNTAWELGLCGLYFLCMQP